MNSKRLNGRFVFLTIIVVIAMLVTPLAALAQSGDNPTSTSEVQSRPAVQPKRFPPKDQPDPQMYRLRREMEKAMLAGNQAEARSLAVTGVGKLLVLLVDFSGTDSATWQEGDSWDPYGVAETVDASELGDCTNVITQTQTFTYGPTLHNAIPRPETGDYAYKGESPTMRFGLWAPDSNQQHYEDMVFGDGLHYSYNAQNGDPVNVNIDESLRKYYEKLSGGTYTVEGDVVGWIPLPHSMPFYGADLCPGNLSLAGGSGAGADGWFNNARGVEGVDYGTPQTVVEQAVDWINANMPGFDWSQYDGNGDGVIDTVVVVTAGVDEANTGANEHAIWPHSSSVDYCADPGPDGVCDTADDIRTGAYIMQGETTGVSTFTHEFGHRLGADDLYAYGYGETSAGIWSNMADDRGHGWPWDSGSVGMDPWHKLGWGWLNPLVVNYDDPTAEVNLTQASDPAPGEHDALLVHLPDQVEQIEAAHSGSNMWWGGRENLMNNLVYRPVDLSGATTAALTFWNKYDIEEGWDFGFVQVSTDNGATWTSLENEHTTFDHDPQAIDYVVDNLPGLTGNIDEWRQETFDLSAYAGQQISLAFRYATDWGTLGNGWWIDDVEVTADGASVFFDDVESGPGPWVADPADGFQISDGVFTYPHYYLFEWRNDAGIDHNLAVGRCDVENFGMIGWYINDHKYTANEIYDNLDGPPSFGPKGKALVIDAHPAPLRDASSTVAHNPRSNISYRCYGVRDAAFGLDDLAPFYVTQPPTDPSRWGNPNFEYPAQSPVSAFHDSVGYYPGLEYTNIRPIDDPRGPRYAWVAKERDASVVIPASAPYGVGPANYPTGTGFLQWMTELGAYYGFWDWMAGTGNPGDTHVQYGVHVAVEDKAADGSWGKIKFWNAMTEVDGTVTQTSSTTPTVEGSYVDVAVSADNIGGALEDGMIVVPVDPDAMYVPGSAYGGATPLTAGYAAQIAQERNLANLANLAAGAKSPDDVVAVAWMGPIATGEMLDFGFTVKVTAMSGELQHDAAVFDGATFINDLAGSPMTIVDNSTYPNSRSRRFDVDRDTFIDGSQPSGFFGSDQTLWVGFYDQQRPLVHTPLQDIPRDSYVDAAYLYLYVYEGHGWTTWATSVINVDAHAVSTEWMPYAANWWMPWSMPGGDFGPAVGTSHLGSGRLGTWLRLDVTSAVEDMLRGGFNQGFILTSNDTRGVQYAFASKENWTGKTGYIRVYFKTAQ